MRSSDAGLAAPQRAALLLGVRDHLGEGLERGVDARVHHLRIGEDVGHRLQIVVTELPACSSGASSRCRSAWWRRARCRRAWPGDARHRARAAAAGDVLDDEVSPDVLAEVLRELAQEHVAAAARARMGDERDHLVRIGSRLGSGADRKRRRRARPDRPVQPQLSSASISPPGPFSYAPCSGAASTIVNRPARPIPVFVKTAGPAGR